MYPTRPRKNRDDAPCSLRPPPSCLCHAEPRSCGSGGSVSAAAALQLSSPLVGAQGLWRPGLRFLGVTARRTGGVSVASREAAARTTRRSPRNLSWTRRSQAASGYTGALALLARLQAAR